MDDFVRTPFPDLMQVNKVNSEPEGGLMNVRFHPRRTLLTAISALVVVSILISAAWPVGAQVAAVSRPAPIALAPAVAQELSLIHI